MWKGIQKWINDWNNDSMKKKETCIKIRERHERTLILSPDSLLKFYLVVITFAFASLNTSINLFGRNETKTFLFNRLTNISVGNAYFFIFAIIIIGIRLLMEYWEELNYKEHTRKLIREEDKGKKKSKIKKPSFKKKKSKITRKKKKKT